MPTHGVESGILRPVMIPDIADVADIQDGLKNFYYGSVESSYEASETNIPLKSILGRIIQVDNEKINIANGVANSPFTIDSSTTTAALKLTNTSGTITINATGSTRTLTLPSSAGTFALTSESTLSKLANVGTATGGDTVGTIQIGSVGTSIYNIGTGTGTVNRTLNIGTGENPTSGTRTINIGSSGSVGTRIIRIGNSGTDLNTTGTLTHTGSAGITGVLTMTGNIAMGGTYKVSGLAAATADGEAVRYEQAMKANLGYYTDTHVLTSSDTGKTIFMNGSSTNDLQIPSGLPSGMIVTVVQMGTVRTYIKGASGFDGSIHATPGYWLRTRYSSATLVHRGSDSWYAFGDLSAS